jgi:uncharacterized protein YecE (DUF72 family)
MPACGTETEHLKIMSNHAPIRIGTAAWGIASRYLTEIPAGGSHLERYARVFSATEIDTSFYRHHRMATYVRWAQSVGENFRFAVKAPKALTHEGSLIVGKSEVLDRFLTEVEGLGRKLGVLLVQLPPSLAFDKAKVRAFFKILRRNVSPGVALACEPRHATWSTGAVNTLLEQLEVTRVAVDPPRWGDDARPGGDRRLAYFRMHGFPRIYYSDYDAQRLEALKPRLEEAARESDAVWCIFDNTAHGHAIGNALSIQLRLRTTT